MKNRLKGKVISDKQDKTVVVEVSRVKEHPRYGKRYETHKRYKAHDEENKFIEGNLVEIEEVRPVSKDKRWKVIKKIKRQ